MFLQAESASIQTLHNIFRQYEVVSGQQVNLQNSTVRFIRNVSPRLQQIYIGLLSTPLETYSDRYIGLPSVVLHSKVLTFGLL